MELIKTAVRVGNSAGVLLPKEYLNSEVKITLTPRNIEKEVINILSNENLLKDILGIYVTGSYARKEETIESDIDVLVITNNTDKRIKKEKYDLLLISKNNLEKTLKRNVMPLLPMIKEAKPIINGSLLEEYKNIKLTRKNLKWHVEITKSIIKVIRAAIDLDKELEKTKTGDAPAYSLILHLRGIYLINCLRKNKSWSSQELINLIRKISNSTTSYERYLYVKNNNGKIKDLLPIPEAEKLLNYIINENSKQEKWLKEKKD